MSKSSKYLFVISFVLIFFLGIILFAIESSNKKQVVKEKDFFEFHAIITSKNESSYEISKYKDNKFIKDYEYIYVSLDPGLNVGDILKIKAENEIMESSPPQIKVISYEVVSSFITMEGNLINPLGTPSFENNEEFISNLETLIDSVTLNLETTTYEKISVDNFVYLMDFLILDNPIGDITYSSLSSDEKLKTINLMLTYETLIKEELPKTYQGSLNNIIALYLDELVFICNNGPCKNETKEFLDYKKEVNLEWDYLTEITNLSKVKLSDWYLIYNGK